MILLAVYCDDEVEIYHDNEDYSPNASSDEGTVRQQSFGCALLSHLNFDFR